MNHCGPGVRRFLSRIQIALINARRNKAKRKAERAGLVWFPYYESGKLLYLGKCKILPIWRGKGYNPAGLCSGVAVAMRGNPL